MASKLPPVGVRAVVEDAGPFNKAMDTINKRIADFQKRTADAAKNASPLQKLFDKIGLSVDGLRQKFLEMSGASGSVVNALTEILGALGPMGLAIAAATAAVAGFLALGVRGAGLKGLAQSFDALTASIGILSTELLTDLRRASHGTVSDFELIRLANVALAGAAGKFGQEFGRNLPRLLEIARAQAKATGQSVDFLFQSLITGIKRGSPLLIDNTGLVLSVTEAQEAYAASIGKSVSQLTEEEKQIALLNATLTAGQAAVDRAANTQETAAEKLARAGATVTNIFDKLALAVQPAFEAVLDVVNGILSGIDQIITAISPLITMIVNGIVQPFTTAAQAVLNFIQPLINLASNVLPYVIGIIQIFQNIIGGLINFLWGLIEPLVRPIIDAFNRIGAFLSNPDNVRALFVGGARMIGALASGIMDAANRYVFPAVIQIATFIADFLMGLSPPPKGPLSTIDKGGANLMVAWLEGITGVSLDPVKKVAAEVSAALGSIGKMTREQVEARLLQLDAALQPFADRLAIVKSHFDALREPAEAALRAVDRQLEKAVQALAQGDEQAAASVRALDAQRAAIEGALDGQQELLDAAQLQYALAKAQQEEERTLLDIRQRMLGPVKSVTDKIKEAVGGAGKPPKEETPKAGTGTPPTMPGGMPGIGLPPGGEGQNVLDLIGGQGAVDDAIAAMREGFLEGLDPKTAGLFGKNQSELQKQLDRIGSVDIGGRITERLAGLREGLDTALNEAFEGIRHFFEDTGEGTLDGLIKSAENWLMGLPARFVTALSTLWTTLSESEPIVAVRNFFTGQTEDSTTLYGMLTQAVTWFTELPTRITDALGTLWMQIVDGPLAPFIRFFGGTEEYTLQWYLSEAVRFFTELPGRLVSALQGLGLAIWNSVAVPVIGGINGIITAVETALNAIRGAAADVLDNFAEVFDFVISLTPTGGLIPSAHDMAAILRAGHTSLTRLSIDPPGFLTGAARGGMFGAGSYIAGERGRELITSAHRSMVFPARATAALEAIAAVIPSVVAQPAPMPIPAGNTYNANDASMTANFYGVDGSRDAMARLRTLQAYRKRR